MQQEIPLEQLRRELNALTAKVEVGNKDTLDLKGKMSKMEETLNDSNREYHTIKHNVAQLQGTIPGLVKVLEKNDETLRLLREDIMSTQHEKRLLNMEGWVKQMQEVATLEMWRKAIGEVNTNTEFRTKITSYWIAIGGVGLLVSVAIGIIHLVSLFSK